MTRPARLRVLLALTGAALLVTLASRVTHPADTTTPAPGCLVARAA